MTKQVLVYGASDDLFEVEIFKANMLYGSNPVESEVEVSCYGEVAVAKLWSESEGAGMLVYGTYSPCPSADRPKLSCWLIGVSQISDEVAFPTIWGMAYGMAGPIREGNLPYSVQLRIVAPDDVRVADHWTVPGL